MKLTINALALALGLATPAIAQQVGLQSTFTMTLTAQETVGAFIATPTQVNTAANRGITYSEPLNPRNYYSPANGATYFTKRVTATSKNNTITTTSEVGTNILTTRYGNREFLIDLAFAGYIPGANPSTVAEATTAIAGYSISAIRLSGSTKDRTYFFVTKKNTAPIYVGYMGLGYFIGQAESDYILHNPTPLLVAGTNQVPSFRSLSVSRVLTIGGVEQPEVLVKDSATYQHTAEFSVFPAYYSDNYSETYYGGNRPITGRANVSLTETYNTKSGLTVRSGVSGTELSARMNDTATVDNAGATLVKGKFGVSSEKAIADVSSYISLVPSALLTE